MRMLYANRFVRLIILSAGIAILAFLIRESIANAANTLEKPVLMWNEHSATVATPVSGYRLPFDRNSLALITNGPYEGDHQTYYNSNYIGSAEAIDFSPIGGWTDIYAARSGTVYLKQNYTSSWGNLIIIQQSDGLFGYYAHLANNSIPVSVGDTVTQGQFLGKVGSTGFTTATHLHFEVRDSVTNQDPYTGDSQNHSIRRIRGIGWYPWYPDPASDSGYTIVTDSDHKVGQCSSIEDIIVFTPAHNQITYHPGHEEHKAFAVTHGNKGYLPPTIVNATHLTNGRNFPEDADVSPQSFFAHMRAYDAISTLWAAQDRVAHQVLTN